MANTFRSAPQSVQPVKKRRRRRHHPRKVSKPQPKRIRTEPKVQKVQPKAKPLRIQEVKECDCCKLARVKSLFSNNQWKLNRPCCITCMNKKNALSGTYKAKDPKKRRDSFVSKRKANRACDPSQEKRKVPEAKTQKDSEAFKKWQDDHVSSINGLGKTRGQKHENHKQVYSSRKKRNSKRDFRQRKEVKKANSNNSRHHAYYGSKSSYSTKVTSDAADNVDIKQLLLEKKERKKEAYRKKQLMNKYGHKIMEKSRKSAGKNYRGAIDVNTRAPGPKISKKQRGAKTNNNSPEEAKPTNEPLQALYRERMLRLKLSKHLTQN